MSDVAFAGDSKTVAWVDRSGTTPRLLTEPANQDTQALISTLNPGASLSLVALDYGGTEVAYVVTPASGNAELVVAQLASGSPLAIGPVTRTAAFSRQGDALAYLEEVPGGIAVQLASIPGVSPPSVGTVPRAAAEALNGFVSEFLIYLGLFRSLGPSDGKSFVGAAFVVAPRAFDRIA